MVVRWENRLHFLTRPRRSSVTVARQIENDDGPARSQPPLNLRPASPCELPPPLLPLARILTDTACSICIPTISSAQSWPNTQRECHPIRRSVSRRANGVTKTLAEEIRGGLRFHRREHMQMVSLQLGPPANFVEFFDPHGDLARIGPVDHDRSNLVLEDIRQPCWCGWGPRLSAPSERDWRSTELGGAKRPVQLGAIKILFTKMIEVDRGNPFGRSFVGCVKRSGTHHRFSCCLAGSHSSFYACRRSRQWFGRRLVWVMLQITISPAKVS